MKHRRNCYISTMVCTKCGCITFVPRKPGHARSRGHLKKLWCPNCLKEVNFVEYPEDMAMRNGNGDNISRV